MATPRQKTASKRNIKKGLSRGLSARQKNRMRSTTFAFPKERKEPLNDAGHVRNAIARFDQVEGVSDAERDAAWRRIRAAARKFGVEVRVRGWRQLMRGGKTGRPRLRRVTRMTSKRG
jgi:hypothetical protein